VTINLPEIMQLWEILSEI